MGWIACRGLLAVSALLAAMLATAAAQPVQEGAEQKEIDPKTTTRVTLGNTTGTPGTTAVVPVYFTPPEGTEVGRMKLEVNFVSRNLTYTKLDAGISAEMGNVNLRAETKESKNAQGLENTTLTLVASFTQSEPPKKGIPSGLLGYFTFQISDSARPATIALRTTVEASELGSTKPMADVRAFDGQVEVVAPGSQPSVACFFFTH